jgi:uncharacterized membrane protein
MSRIARRITLLVLLIQVAWSLPLAVIMAYAWLTSDGPDTSYPCRRGGTCYSGPTVYLILMLVFGTVALVTITIATTVIVRARRRAALRKRLLATGVRARALLVDVQPTSVRINGRRVHRLMFEARPDGRSVRVTERSTMWLPIGTETSIAYDPVEPSRAVLGEDIEKIAAAERAAADRARRSHVDAMFAAQDHARADEATPSALNAMRDAVAANLEGALAELRGQFERGELTEAEYEERRTQWMRLLETRTDEPLT